MIRVALISTRPKLRDILSDAIAREKDLQLIRCDSGAAAASTAARADVLVYEVADPLDAEIPTQLLRSAPRARVLMVAETGDRAALYEMQPIRKVLLNVSMSEVIDAIRFGLEQGDN
jgi:hypothetical protein